MAREDTLTDLKKDLGKPYAALPFQDFPNGMQGLINVSTFGANKYSRGGWREVIDNGTVDVESSRTRIQDALFRHILAYLKGEEKDEESGEDHLSHAVWNMLALIELKH